MAKSHKIVTLISKWQSQRASGSFSHLVAHFDGHLTSASCSPTRIKFNTKPSDVFAYLAFCFTSISPYVVDFPRYLNRIISSNITCSRYCDGNYVCTTSGCKKPISLSSFRHQQKEEPGSRTLLLTMRRFLVCLLMPLLSQAFKWDILPRLSKYPYFLTLGIPDPVLDQANSLAGDNSLTSGRMRETEFMSQFAKQTQVPTDLFNLSSNKSCTVLKGRKQLPGACSGVYDVVVARRCTGLKLAKSGDCPESEVCCYDPNGEPERKVTVSDLDRSVCGLRRTPELVTRELKQSYSGEIPVTHRLQQRLLEELTSPNEICWQAAIMIDGNYACSGAIINSQNILTTAHCLQEVDNPSRLRVLIGTSDLSRLGSCSASLSVSKVLFDNLYDPQTFAHDLAIVKLAKQIDDETCACRVCLPSTSTDARVDSGNLHCIATSYGKSAGGRKSLTTERIAIAPNNQCGTQLNMSPTFNDVLSHLDNSMLCGVSVGSENATARADTITSCAGPDTGAPLACRLDRSTTAYTLVALSSWGLPCEQNTVQIDASQNSKVPTIFAKLTPAMQWITEKSRL